MPLFFQPKVRMYSNFERRTDIRTYEDKKGLFSGVSARGVPPGRERAPAPRLAAAQGLPREQGPPGRSPREAHEEGQEQAAATAATVIATGRLLPAQHACDVARKARGQR